MGERDFVQDFGAKKLKDFGLDFVFSGKMKATFGTLPDAQKSPCIFLEQFSRTKFFWALFANKKSESNWRPDLVQDEKEKFVHDVGIGQVTPIDTLESRIRFTKFADDLHHLQS